MRVAPALVLMVACARPTDNASGRQAPKHLRLHFTLPAGWRHAPWDEKRVTANGVTVHKSTYYRGDMPFPEISLELRTDDHLSAPRDARGIITFHEAVFDKIIEDGADTSLRKNGPCSLLENGRMSRCIAHSAVAPSARTIVGYMQFPDRRGVSALFLSKETDLLKVLAEVESIASSIGTEP